MALTIDEIKEKKIDLEAKVTKLFKDFEKETRVKVGYIDVVHKRIKRKAKSEDVDSVMESPRMRDGEIKTVLLNVRFEDL